MGFTDNQIKIGIAVAVVVLFLIVIWYWFFMRNYTQYASITATTTNNVMADFAYIDGARWMDTTNKNAPGLYTGFAQITMSRKGNVPGYITNGTVTDRYIELPTTAWTSLHNGYEWTLNTWMEIRSLIGTVRYFHGINSVKQNMDKSKTFYMVATNEGNIHPYTPDVRKLVNGKDATFTVDAPFMLTVVRNGRNFLSEPDPVFCPNPGLIALQKRRTPRRLPTGRDHRFEHVGWILGVGPGTHTSEEIGG